MKSKRRVSVFNNVSLDGYFVDADGDMSWAYRPGPDTEWDSFVSGNAKGDAIFVFGRTTYDMMASYWPTPDAIKAMPVVANAMNNQPKVVFSRKMKRAAWNNTRLVKSDPVAEIRKMKNVSGPDLVIFGSGSIVAQLAREGLIDEYQIVIVPVVLGKGRTMFEGVTKKFNLKLTKSRTFTNGNVFLTFEV